MIPTGSWRDENLCAQHIAVRSLPKSIRKDTHRTRNDSCCIMHIRERKNGFSHHAAAHARIIFCTETKNRRNRPRFEFKFKKIPRIERERLSITKTKISNMSLHLRNHRERIRDAKIVSKTCSTVAIRSATDAAVASALASAVSDLPFSQ